MLRAAIVVVVGLVVLARGSVVLANCLAPPAAIIWSSPADGAVDVPTNAQLFVLTSIRQYHPAQIRVNGGAVVRGALPFSYAPALQPGTRYTVSVPTGSMSEPELTFSFTTGSGPSTSERGAAPSVSRVSRMSTRDLSPVCQRAWQVSGCYDTGQDTHVVFETAARPVLWLLDRAGFPGGDPPFPILWPGECLDPEIFIAGRAPSTCRGPVWLIAVSATGQRETVEVPCSAFTPATPELPTIPPSMAAPPTPPSSAEMPTGCSLAGAGSAGWLAPCLASLLAVAARRRRPRRSRS